MQQVFAESWPFRSTGYIAARIHIDRANLIGDEIHHHLVLASEKYDAMTTCCPQPLGPIVVRLPKNCFSILVWVISPKLNGTHLFNLEPNMSNDFK